MKLQIFLWMMREAVTASCFLPFWLCLLGNFKEIYGAVKDVKAIELFLKWRDLDGWWNHSPWVLWRSKLKSLWHYGRERLICQTVSVWWTWYLLTWCCTSASQFLFLSAQCWYCQVPVIPSNYCTCRKSCWSILEMGNLCLVIIKHVLICLSVTGVLG